MMKLTLILLGSAVFFASYARAVPITEVCSVDPQRIELGESTTLFNTFCEAAALPESASLAELVSFGRVVTRSLQRAFQREAEAAVSAQALQEVDSAGDEDVPVTENQRAIATGQETLEGIIRRLVDNANQRRGLNTYSPISNSPLAQSLGSLITSFPTEASRRANPTGLYQALRQVVQNTSEGERLIRCFEELNDADVAEFRVEFFGASESEQPENESTGGTYSLERNQSTGRFSKVMRLNPANDTAGLVTVLAHEMEHACNYNTQREHQRARAQAEALVAPIDAQTSAISDRYPDGTVMPEDQLNQIVALAERKAAIEQELAHRIQRDSAVDEMRAYRLDARIFAELAATSPSYFCQFNVYDADSGRLEQNGVIRARMQINIDNGSYFDELIARYQSLNGYDPASFYEMQDGAPRVDENGRPVLLASMRQLLAAPQPGGPFNVR